MKSQSVYAPAWPLLAILFLPLIASAKEPVEVAHELTLQNLVYKYGADDASKGALDCSGYMMVTFKEAWNIDLPDQAGKQLEYIRQHGEVWDATTPNWSPKNLKPGDLVFWTGTYKCHRPSPVTHVMMYMGNNMVVGAQNHGKRIGLDSPGIGYYPFKPRPPQGNPSEDQQKYRDAVFLYAYGRLHKLDTTPVPQQTATAVSTNTVADPNTTGH